MVKNHKRRSELEMGRHAWIAYNLRYIIAGDIASAGETFDGIAMRLTHLGAALNLAIAGNETIAMNYDQKIRTYADELSKFRAREKDIINLPKGTDRRIKRDVRRERGTTTTIAQRTTDFKRRTGKTNDRKGGETIGNARNAKKRKWNSAKNDWGANSDWKNNNDWDSRPLNDWNKPPSWNNKGGGSSSNNERKGRRRRIDLQSSHRRRNIENV